MANSKVNPLKAMEPEPALVEATMAVSHIRNRPQGGVAGICDEVPIYNGTTPTCSLSVMTFPNWNCMITTLHHEPRAGHWPTPICFAQDLEPQLLD